MYEEEEEGKCEDRAASKHADKGEAHEREAPRHGIIKWADLPQDDDCASPGPLGIESAGTPVVGVMSPEDRRRILLDDNTKTPFR